MTLTEAKEMLAIYIAAEKDLLMNGKAIGHNGKSLGKENLQEIIKGRQEWERKVRAFTPRKPLLARFN